MIQKCLSACDLLSSSNFWTMVSGLGGAVLGGIVSYRLQKKMENDKNDDLRASLFQKNFWFIGNSCSIAKMLSEGEINKFRNHPGRHMNIPCIHTYLPEPDKSDPATDLYFLSETGDFKVVCDIMDIKSRYSTLYSAFQERNRLILEEVQPRIPGIGPNFSGNFTEENIISIFGNALYYRLKSITDSIYLDIDFLIENHKEIELLAGNTFTKIFPNRKLIVMGAKI